MKAINAVLAVLLVSVGGCTGSSRHPTPTPSPAVRTAAGSGPTASPSIQRLPGLVLTADLAEPPARWQRVAFIPFSGRAQDLGRMTFPEGPNSQPTSFGVALDGSIWIDDRWKSRVAHYSPTGRYLGAIAGLRDRGDDLVLVSDRVVVLTREVSLSGKGALMVWSGPGGMWTQATVNENGRPLRTGFFAPSPSEVIVELGGWDDDPSGAGPRGFAQVDIPGSGQVHLLPGYPFGSGMYFRILPVPGSDHEYRLQFSGPSGESVQPVGIRVQVGDPGATRIVPAIAGVGEETAIGDDVVMFVRVAPSRPADVDRYGGGWWLLRVGRSPVLWERLPGPGVGDDIQARHIAAGPDGGIYLMVARKSGMEILRRP